MPEIKGSTLSDRADAAIDHANARYTSQTNRLQPPPSVGFRTGHDGEFYTIATTQGTYSARNPSTSEPGIGDLVALNVPRQGTATFTVISH